MDDWASMVVTMRQFNPKLEIRKPKTENRKLKSEIRGPKEIRNPKSETTHEHSKTQLEGWTTSG
jgi:hypothetical protein